MPMGSEAYGHRLEQQIIKDAAQRWVILVGGGYGAFLFAGDEAAAEAMRCHKARWEGAAAKKRLATDSDITDAPSACWNHPGFNNRGTFYCKCGDCAVTQSGDGK